jgi:hypothetical protein
VVVAHVRSGVDDFAEGEAIARGVYGRLQRAAATGYTYILAQTAEPLYLGADERGLHRWSTAFTCGIKRGAIGL